MAHFSLSLCFSHCDRTAHLAVLPPAWGYCAVRRPPVYRWPLPLRRGPCPPLLCPVASFLIFNCPTPHHRIADLRLCVDVVPWRLFVVVVRCGLCRCRLAVSPLAAAASALEARARRWRRKIMLILPSLFCAGHARHARHARGHARGHSARHTPAAPAAPQRLRRGAMENGRPGWSSHGAHTPGEAPHRASSEHGARRAAAPTAPTTSTTSPLRGRPRATIS